MTNPASKVPLLYVAEASTGGIAEYSIHQAKALKESGANIRFLCRPDFPLERIGDLHPDPGIPLRVQGKSKPGRLASYIRDSRKFASAVVRTADSVGAGYVLLDCFREYLSPFWAGSLRKAARGGLPFGVVSHDPVRDFVVGPKWWHELCIRRSYSFVRDVFVHDDSRIDWGGSKPANIKVHQIPHGPYTYGRVGRSREEMRNRYGLDPLDQVVLSFGQIRDNKNLDCFVRTLPLLPAGIKLVVAGSGNAKSQKPPSAYVELAEELGVADRCVFDIRYIPNSEVPDLFAMSDAVLMTYSKSFVSASGVLSAAVAARLPVLASGGGGPMKKAILDYSVGEWVENLDAPLLADALTRILSRTNQYAFDPYIRDHTWERNAAIVLGAMEAGASA